MITKVLSQRLVLLVIGLAAGSGILVPVSYGSLHPVTSSEIADGTIQSVDIGDGQVKTPDIASSAVTSAKIAAGGVANSDIAANAVTGNKIADETIKYADVSEAFIAVDSKLDCNCGGTGWDPDGSSNTENIYDSRITPNSVVSVTVGSPAFIASCGASTLRLSGVVTVICDRSIAEGAAVNFAIFNPQ